MKTLVVLFLSFFAFVAVQANIEFSQTAKDCIAEIKTDENSIRKVVHEKAPFPEDNELVIKFFECCYRSFISDSNELIVDDKYKDYVTNIFAVRVDGRRKLAKLLAKDCIEQCKANKGSTKGLTAVKIANCLREKLHEYIDK